MLNCPINMSSSCEENAEHLQGADVECNATEEILQPPTKDDKSLLGHVKPKRRRRGKKRKHRKESVSAAACENGTVSPTWDSDEDLSCGFDSFNNVVIRPINVPKAPENSTQFIMDDHDECRLYMSFENPKPYFSELPNENGEDYVVTEPIGEDAAYQDIDYEYESPQDFDNSAYYDREFELSYNNNRYEELMCLPRTQLISTLETMEFRLKELEDDLTKHNPNPVLEKLQAELLHLQEENMALKECNTKLNVLALKNETDDSVSEHSPDELAKVTGGSESVSTASMASTESDSLNESIEVDSQNECDHSLEVELCQLSSSGTCKVVNEKDFAESVDSRTEINRVAEAKTFFGETVNIDGVCRAAVTF